MSRPLRGTDLKRLHRSWRQRTPGRLALLLDGVQTPYNVGAIVRTAAAYRVEELLLAAHATEPSHPGAAKTALGTERYLHWRSFPEPAGAAGAAHQAGYRLVGVELASHATPIHEADLAGDVCLAIGHEDRGLSRPVLAACDLVVYLPQLGRVGSLNVAHAAAIAIWEVRRRAWPPHHP